MRDLMLDQMTSNLRDKSLRFFPLYHTGEGHQIDAIRQEMSQKMQIVGGKSNLVAWSNFRIIVLYFQDWGFYFGKPATRSPGSIFGSNQDPLVHLDSLPRLQLCTNQNTLKAFTACSLRPRLSFVLLMKDSQQIKVFFFFFLVSQVDFTDDLQLRLLSRLLPDWWSQRVNKSSLTVTSCLAVLLVTVIILA